MPIKAHIDELTPKMVAGWAWNSHAPNASVRVKAILGGEIIGTVDASIFRRDLLDARIGTGRHGFSLAFVRELTSSEVPDLLVHIKDDSNNEFNVPLPAIALKEFKVTAPDRLSPAKRLTSISPSLQAREVFDDIDWIITYIKHIDKFNVDFLIKQLIASRYINSNLLERYVLPSADNNQNIAIQFWDGIEIPHDVMNSIMENHYLFGDRQHFLFDDSTSRDFIVSIIGIRAAMAYDYCHHPAMKSDYFRLCYLYACGGFYIDADDLLLAPLHQVDLRKDTIFLSPLIRERNLVHGTIYWRSVCEFIDAVQGGDLDQIRDWQCVFANDVIATNPLNEVIKIALIRATILIEACQKLSRRPNIHAVTGPDNITFAALIHIIHAALNGQKPSQLGVFDRKSLIQQKRVSYKKDNRYWVNFERRDPGYIPNLSNDL